MVYTQGLVLGKFMPPHKGHQYLFLFAKQHCKNLTIVVDCLANQTIPPELRKQWIEQLIPNVKVVALSENMPQQPEDNPDFWNIWKNTLIKAIGYQPDVLIAAMDYGWKLAEVLGCDFIPCDIERESIPISATEIRDDPMKHWDYIVPTAKPYFMKKVCLIGPESTGKSTCAKSLAQLFNTVHVPEYAKALITHQHGHFYRRNILPVAYAQTRSEKALEHMVNKVMICDSDVITTMTWSEILFGELTNFEHGALDELIRENSYHMTFLFDPTVEWVSDIHRQSLAEPEKKRWEFFYKMQKSLEYYQRPYQIVTGDHAMRFDTTKEVITNLITKK